MQRPSALRLSGRLIAAALLLSASQAFAWGQHYMITDRALEHESMAFTSEEVAVVPLEDFLAQNPEGLAKLFDDYYSWLEETGAKRFRRMTFDPQKPTREEFLRAARLHPDTFFPLVERVIPGATPPEEGVPLKEVSPYLKEVPPLLTVFRDVTGQNVSIRSVLSTFSDEPDWQMDHTLWGFTEYGYGEQPYGNPEGEGSKAPFHMQFMHENVLVRKFASHILEGMVPERMELFLRLSRFAFENGQPYWGYRFLAWSIHYAQDLCQPYHSKALPSAGTGYYLRYIVSFTKKRMQQKTTQVVANRHFIYEDFVAYSLQDSYTGTSEMSRALADFLKTGEADLDVKDTKALTEEITAFAAKHSPVIDKTIIKAFGRKLTKDHRYDLENDPNYKITDLLAKLPPEKGEILLKETQKDFSITARATRTLIRMARAAN